MHDQLYDDECFKICPSCATAQYGILQREGVHKKLFTPGAIPVLRPVMAVAEPPGTALPNFLFAGCYGHRDVDHNATFVRQR
jgi:hypothetical protein